MHTIESLIYRWGLQRHTTCELLLPGIGYLRIDRRSAEVIINGDGGQRLLSPFYLLVLDALPAHASVVNIIDMLAQERQIATVQAERAYQMWLEDQLALDAHSIRIEGLAVIGFDDDQQLHIQTVDPIYEAMLNPANPSCPIEPIRKNHSVRVRHSGSQKSSTGFFLWLSIILGVIAVLYLTYTFLPADAAQAVNQALGISGSMAK